MYVTGINTPTTGTIPPAQHINALLSSRGLRRCEHEHSSLAYVFPLFYTFWHREQLAHTFGATVEEEDNRKVFENLPILDCQSAQQNVADCVRSLRLFLQRIKTQIVSSLFNSQQFLRVRGTVRVKQKGGGFTYTELFMTADVFGQGRAPFMLASLRGLQGFLELLVVSMLHGTDFLDKKIYLIGVFAVMVALLSIVFNSFFTLVFIRNPTIRKTPIFYFGILAILDIFMAFNYIALMAVPLLWLYHIFLSYLRPVMAESCCAMFSSMLLIVLATTERLLRTINTSYCTTLRRFWWMFLARNILDRILPFFVLVAMNFFIIRSLKQEQFRQLGSLHRGERSQSRMGRATLRDATRVLISCVSMYLMSQSLQVLITFWEAIHKSSLEVELYEFYSYLNDAMSIMTLLSRLILSII
ncbi:unnamed protein product [Toxocara canis]|uniref:G_PROTEIN_RECEP_F1_2 domain-containing protein n=1 Tax=Toxocara canis TaxID=6265 RepID=A0A183UKJ4_TOXCA|nr:unnamed protein product [Toxocara canis]